MNKQDIFNFTYTDANDIDKLNEALLAYPQLIYEAEMELSDRIKDLKEASARLATVEASKLLSSTNKTVQEKKASVILLTQEEVEKEINCQIAELKAKAEYNKFKHGFDALKKVANNVEARINSKL